MSISLNCNTQAGSKDNLITMVRILTKKTFGLKVCHINAQSLNNKIDEFQLVFENSNVDVICVSETWFYPDVSDSIYKLNGYSLFRSDRITNAGGVAIYVKSSICCKTRSKHDIGDNIEHILVEIIHNDKRLLLGNVYRPNKNINMDSFLEKLSTCTLGYNDVIITGDFNANILEDNSLMEDMSSIGLYLVNSKTPTHFTATSNSLLDLCFITNDSKILSFEQLSASMFSRHDLLFLSYDFDTSSETQPRTIEYRDFKSINYQLLALDLNNINWSDVCFLPTVDEQLSFLHQNISYLFEKHIPVRRKVIRNEKPWFTTEIKNLIIARNYAYERWKRFRTQELYDKFKNAMAQVNSKIRMAKRIFYNNRFQTAIDSGSKWREIRKMGIINDTSAQKDAIDVNTLNQQFASIPMPQIDMDFYDNTNNLDSSNIRLLQCFNFLCCTQEEVLKSFFDIKSNSVGSDKMHPKFVKLTLSHTLFSFTHLFNTIITTSTFPANWKHAKIIPIPKADKSYRPIAILPFLSKVFEKIIHSQISSHLHNRSILTERQSGFRPKHSCISALIDVSEDIRSQIDKRNCVSFLILLDHSKAFDTVHHSLLRMKLKKLCNFSTTALKLMMSYLGGRSQSVSHGSNTSTSCMMPRGVPQGSILGPLLYSIYANDLPLQLRNCKIQMYADDVQLYISCTASDAANCIDLINEDLNRIQAWASANGLSLNPKKSVAIIIGNSKHLPTMLPSLKINNEVINIVDKAKNLGVIFNKQLDWSDHIKTNCGKTFTMLRSLWISQCYTPLPIRILLAKTYLLPSLMYGCELFSSCDSVSKRRLNVAYNNIARYVFGVKRNCSISRYAIQIYNMSFENLLKCRVLLFLHKVIYTRQPGYLYKRLSFSRSNRGKKINSFKYNKTTSEQHFFINSIRLWSQLPTQIQTISNASQFRTAIYMFFTQSL